MMRLGLRLLRRDWRAGELRVLLLAVLIAVTCMTSVAFFTDRIGQALRYQSSELLGADLRVVADHAVPEAIYSAATAAALRTAETRSFRSMVLAAGQSQLAEIKAVSEGYPLRGGLRISQDLFDAEIPATGLPAAGEVWPDPRLLQQLQLGVGDLTQVGDAQLRISAVLRYEPDRSGDMFSIAPRLLMNMADLPATGLIQEGSRIRYALLVAGEPDQVNAFHARIKDSLGQGERVEGAADARREVRNALTRAQQFLGLAAVVAVVLACVAIAMAARRYAQRHLDTCAMLRCLGARQRQINSVFMLQLIALGLIGGLFGVVLGYAAQTVLAQLLGQLVLVNLPAPSLIPVVMGLGIALISLLGFALPPVLQLREVPTLRVFRRDLEGNWQALTPLSRWCYGLGVLALAALVYFQAGDPAMGRMLLLGLAGTALVLWLVAFGLVKLLKRLGGNGSSALRFGLNNLTRRTQATVVQVMAFGVGIMVLLLLTVVRGDLLQGWADSLPPDAPNRFVINIQQDQVDAVRDFFDRQGMQSTQLYPMIRARLVAINHEDIRERDFGDERANHLAQRTFNLSWAQQLSPDNRLVAGQWWGDNPVPQFSVEDGIAEALNIAVGDTLTYLIAGEEISAPVTSLRKVQWDNLRANFFVTAAPGTLDGYPGSFITSFYLPDDRSEVLNALVQTFPNLTVIDVAAIMNQIRLIIARVSLAVEYVFLFTLGAGLMVMFAAIQSTLDERRRENAILRALGARRQRLWQSLLTEFASLGALSGLLAAILASVLGYAVARFVLELDYTGNAWIWLAGVLIGGIGIGLAGILGTRSVVNSPPLKVLREN